MPRSFLCRNALRGGIAAMLLASLHPKIQAQAQLNRHLSGPSAITYPTRLTVSESGNGGLTLNELLLLAYRRDGIESERQIDNSSAWTATTRFNVWHRKPGKDWEMVVPASDQADEIRFAIGQQLNIRASLATTGLPQYELRIHRASRSGSGNMAPSSCVTKSRPGPSGGCTPFHFGPTALLENVTMAEFAKFLSGLAAVDGMVVDSTGLTDRYHIQWTGASQLHDSSATRSEGVDTLRNVDATLRRSLGMTLVRVNGTAPTLKVANSSDRAERDVLAVR